MTYLYLDIETIPAQTEEAKAAVASRVKPPANMKKADTIAAWEKDSKAQAVEDAISKTSLDAGYGQICCIGLAINDGPVTSISWPLNAESEGLAIAGFFETASGLIGNGFPIIVGHYVAAFDLRFIWQRAMVIGIRVPGWMPKDPKPWDASVFDTMTAWKGAKDTIGLDELCSIFGIDGKGDVDGSKVAGMFSRGEHKAIAEYCRGDVERVRSVHRKMLRAYGEAA